MRPKLGRTCAFPSPLEGLCRPTIRRALSLALLLSVLGMPYQSSGSAFASGEAQARHRLLNAPFHIGSGVIVGKLEASACPRPFPPVHNLLGTIFYIDKKASIIDPQKAAEDAAARKPLMDFKSAMLLQADAYLRSDGKNVAAARCALSQLDSWAGANALTGEFNYQGAAHRKWALAALSIAYLAIRDAPGLDAVKLQHVAAWLGRIGHIVREPYAAMKIRNNHLYWAAVATMAAGIAADDRDLFDWGIQAARIGIADIQPDGSLPLEVARGQRALGYHFFALTPLELAAQFALANGVDLYRENNHGLDRLANLAVNSLRDRSTMTRLANAEQKWEGIDMSVVAWMEPHYARTHDKRLLPYLRKNRPIPYPFTGDITVLFGVPLP